MLLQVFAVLHHSGNLKQSLGFHLRGWLPVVCLLSLVCCITDASQVEVLASGEAEFMRTSAAKDPELVSSLDLASLKPGALRKRAAAMGVSDEKLEKADDADDRKLAFIELILAAQLTSLKPGALRRRAASMGVGDVLLEEADDADDRKAAFISLLVAAELAALQPGALRKRAVAMGVSESQIEEADDADDRKMAFLKLVLAAGAAISSKDDQRADGSSAAVVDSKGDLQLMPTRPVQSFASRVRQRAKRRKGRRKRQRELATAASRMAPVGDLHAVRIHSSRRGNSQRRAVPAPKPAPVMRVSRRSVAAKRHGVLAGEKANLMRSVAVESLPAEAVRAYLAVSSPDVPRSGSEDRVPAASVLSFDHGQSTLAVQPLAPTVMPAAAPPIVVITGPPAMMPTAMPMQDPDGQVPQPRQEQRDGLDLLQLVKVLAVILIISISGLVLVLVLVRKFRDPRGHFAEALSSHSRRSMRSPYHSARQSMAASSKEDGSGSISLGSGSMGLMQTNSISGRGGGGHPWDRSDSMGLDYGSRRSRSQLRQGSERGKSRSAERRTVQDGTGSSAPAASRPRPRSRPSSPQRSEDITV